MFLQPLTDSVIDLNFMPLEDLPEIYPSIIAQNCRIAGFKNQNKGLFYNELIEDVILVYTKLTLPELSRFYCLAEQNAIVCDWEKICSHFKLRWNEDLKNIFLNLNRTKLTFQNWASKKECGQNDLQILNWAFKKYDAQKIDVYLNKLSQLNPTKQIGVKILEYGLERFSDLDMEVIFAQNSTSEKVLEKLTVLKYPQSTLLEKQFRERNLNISWPAHVKSLCQRNGDTFGLEIRFFCNSYEDFDKKLSGLNQIKPQLEKDLWRSE